MRMYSASAGTLQPQTVTPFYCWTSSRACWRSFSRDSSRGKMEFSALNGFRNCLPIKISGIPMIAPTTVKLISTPATIRTIPSAWKPEFSCEFTVKKPFGIPSSQPLMPLV